ncbi:MAG TPA: hybrid sensor histidine kinase/response regulator, partial [Myxococcota bacterium]
RLAADDDYRSFLRLLGRTLAASLAVTHALEHEARSKDDFLAMLGHELRNPLAPVVSALHLARRQPGLSPAVGRQLDVIERQTINLTRIVDDLLDVSRISRGRVVLRNSDIDLADVVRAAVDAVASALATREQTLTVSLPSRPLPVHGDPVRLEQVVVNLLTNASTYSDVGGRSAVTVSLDDHTVTVAVDDDDIGIAAATLPHVFELFHQAERSLDRSQGGLGIGLTVVKQLVELHGGRVGARSAGPGKGSTFHITLPLQAPSPVVAPSTTTASGSLSVLVVDDNIDAANALAELLELWEHEVQIAFDGSSALRLAGDTAFDVIILDIGLPDVDGYEVATRLRASGSTSRIVALTGYGQAADKARARAAGFDEHLVKPVMPKALEAVLRRAEPRSA